jgi:hypothetical protein
MYVASLVRYLERVLIGKLITDRTRLCCYSRDNIVARLTITVQGSLAAFLMSNNVAPVPGLGGNGRCVHMLLGLPG